MLESLHLKNYGIHEDLKISFAAGINLVGGANGAGKTTVLSGIHAALAGSPLDPRHTWESMLRQGSKEGSLKLRYRLGDQHLEITRKFSAKKTSSSLKIGDEEWHKAGEIDEVLSGRLGFPLSLLTTTVFSKQKELDGILDQTTGDRLKTLSRMFGIERAEQAYKALGTSITCFPVTPGLEGRVQDLAGRLQTLKQERATAQQELDQLNALISFLGACDGILEQARQAQVTQDLIRGLTDQKQAVETRLARAVESVAKASKALEQFQAGPNGLVTPGDVQVARQTLAKTEEQFTAQAKRVAALENLKAATEQAALTPVPSLDEIDAATKAHRGALQLVQTLENVLEGSFPQGKNPLEAFQEAVRTAKAAEQEARRPSVASELELKLQSTLQDAIRSLQACKVGTCPTCRQALPGDPQEADRLAHEIDQTKLQLAGAVAERHQADAQKVTAAQQATLEAERALQGEVARLKGWAEGKLSQARPALESAQRALKGLEAAQVVAEQAALAKRRAEQAVDAIPVPGIPVTTQDLATARENLTVLQGALQELERLQGAGEAAAREYEAAAEATVQAAAALRGVQVVEMPDPETLARAKEDKEKLSASIISRRELESRVGILDGSIQSLAGELERASEQLRSEARDRVWVQTLQEVRDAFHVSAYPSEVLIGCADEVNYQIGKYLEILDTPFTFWLDRDSMEFRAKFPDGRDHTADRLSGAERVLAAVAFRLALADTFASGLSFVPLDEPTAAMDQDNLQNLQTLFLALKRVTAQQGRQIILITHAPALHGFMDHVISLEGHHG